MQMTTLGKTGLEVGRLGAGLGELGWLTLDEVATAERLLNAALDGGINFFDTAACYGFSEELIGRTVAHRRHEYILATKCGHVRGSGPVKTGMGGGQPWTAQTIAHSIERSLVRMKTDYLDLVQLHSCDVEVLEKGDAIEALAKARQEGKTRFIGYSGDNEAALWAVESGLFDTLQTSFSLVDQHALSRLFPLAEARGVGIIAKRPIANATWGAERSPMPYHDEYYRRACAMANLGPIPGAPDDPILLAVGFVLAHPEVDTAIVGTENASQMMANIQFAERDVPIAPEAVDELRRRFERLGEGWAQMG